MSFRHISRLLLCPAVTLILLVAAPRLAKSQAQAGISLAAEAGFDGYFKDRQLIPVRVTVENSGPNLEASLQIRLKRQDNHDSVYVHPVSLPTTSRKEFFIYIFPESFFTGSDLKIALVSAEREIAAAHARLDSIRPADRLFGVLAGNPSAFNLLVDIEPSNGNAFVAQLAPEDLPERSQAFSALDVLVIGDIDSGLISPGAIQAIRSWVIEGGHLIVTGGSNWLKTTQGLSDLLPLSPDGSTTLEDLEGIQNFANSRAALDGSAFLSTGKLTAQGEILVGDENVPIVARRRSGHGFVSYLSMDPSQEPFRSWDGMASFYARLLQTGSERPAWSAGIQNFELAAQAIATFPNLPAPPAWLFCGFLGLYVAALGPANYFLLHKLKRRELAWLSIPALVILFSAIALLVGSQMRGRQAILNRMAIVQAWPDAGYARVDGLVGLFSPRRETYQLEIDPPFLAHPIPSGNPVTGRNWIIEQSSNEVVLPQVRTEAGGMQALSVHGAMPAPDISQQLELRVTAGAATLQGSVTNHSGLNFADAVLVVQGETQRLGEIKSGETRDIRVANLAASPATQAGRDANSNPGAPPNPGPPVFSQGGNLLTSEILGTSAFYEDKEIYQRYLLLESFINYDLSDGGAGEGVYLIGWVEGSSLPIEISGGRAESTDLSLYIIALKPATVLE